jgi:VRR-NUC domain
VTEAQLQKAILDLCAYLGAKCFHVYDSRRSAGSGWPDLYIVTKDHRVLIRELKSAKGRLSPEQKEWIAALYEAGQDVDVWRDTDFVSGRILAELKGTTHPNV